MADVAFNTRKLNKRLEKIVERGPYKRIAKQTVKDIQKTVRAGISPATGKSFARLKPSTVKNRKRLAKLNRTHKAYEANRSNLTFTGQLVNAVTSLVIKFGEVTEIHFFISASDRRPYKTGRKSKAKKTPTNSKLAKFLETKTKNRAIRTILGITKSQKGQIRKIFTKYLQVELTKINKR